MQTRREYLIDLGLAKAGRGKFSQAGKDALAAAATKGITFSDDEAKAAKAAEPKVEKEVKEKPYNPGATAWLSPKDYRFPEGEYRAMGTKDGKTSEYSLREACNRCRVSLCNHECDTPTILGDIVIKIVPVKGG